MAWLRIAATLATACVAAHCFGRPVEAQDSTEGLAAAAQNPVAAMYSLPFQNNTYFGAGPNHDKTANVLNIQPVLPFTVGGWNIISRSIAPLIYVPSVSAGFGASSLGENTTAASSGPLGIRETFGLGDIN
ncbi:MAG: putative neuromedin [Rhodospirillales bacterium]|nr:putative neuromedin [Rhodospirillales bacterium]